MVQRILRLYRDAFSGLPRDLWLLAFAAFVNRSGTMVLPFITLYLTVDRGLSTKEAGQIVGIYGIGSVAGAYLGGWLSDRIGAVRAQQASLVLGGVGFLMLGTLEDRLEIAVAVLFVSLVVEAFRPAVMASFAERSPARLKAKSFALLRLMSNLGIGVGPAVGGVLALYDYQWLFIADAATCWLAAAFLSTLASLKRPGRVADRPEEERPRAPWRDGPFILLLGLVVAFASVLFQIFSTLPLYFHEQLGYRENVIGLLLFLNGFLIVAFEMILIQAVQNRDRMRTATLGAVLLCAGYALIPYGKAPWYMALTVVVWTFGEMLALPIVNTIVAERAGKGYEGQYMGMYAMAYSIAFIVAPVAGTFIYESYSPTFLWNVIGVLGLVLWLSFTVLRRSFVKK